MKKWIIIILSIAMLFGLCSCGTSLPSNSGSKEIDISSYSREELLAMRDDINNILNDSEQTNTAGSAEAEGNQTQVVPSGEQSNPTSATEIQLPPVPVGDQSPATDFVYASNGAEIQINKYIGSGGVVVIPSEIDGLPVTRIAQKAFYKNGNCSGIVLPDTIKYIGEFAFGGVSFEDDDAGVVVLPKSLIEVGSNAFAYSRFSGIVIECNCEFVCTFENMDNLQFVYIVEGATPTLSTRAFGYGEVLSTAIIPASVTDFKKDDVFKGDNIVTVYTPAGSVADKYGTTNFVCVNTEEYNAMVEQYSAYLEMSK